MRKFSAVPTVAMLLSGCGGGGNASLPAPVSGSPHLPSASAQVTIKVPTSVAGSLTRRPAYVPSTVGSVRVSVVSVNGAAPSPAIPDVVQALTAATPGCSTATGPLICTVNATLPIGSVVLAITVYQSTDGSGTPLSTNNVSATISGTGSNSVNVTLGGVPATITLGGPFVAPADGSTKTFLMSVTAKDASGSTIIAPGNYSVPITLSVSNDPNSAISLGTPQETAPSATGPNVVSVSYNSSKPLTSATITASATGAANATTQIDPLVYSPTSLAALVISGLPGSLTVSEANYSGAFTIGATSPIATTSCVPASCTPASAGGQVTINVQPTNAVGMLTMTVTDANAIAANVPVGVASTSGGIAIPGAPTFFSDPLSAGMTNPQNPVTGSDGRMWFSENSGSKSYAAAMTTAGVVSDYGPLTGGSTPVINSAALGPDGNVYYVDMANTQVDVVAPSGAISVNASISAVSVADVIAEGPDNQMWIFGTRSLSPTNAIMTMAPNGSTSLMTLTGAALGTVTSMLAAPDGNMWFTQVSPSGIGKITPGGVVSFATGLTGNPNPGLALGSDGCLWGTETIAGAPAVTMIFVGTTTVAEITSGISAGAGPIGGIAPGGDGNLWFAEPGTGSVARLTTAGGITEFSAGAGHVPSSMVLAPNGEMWFLEYSKASLGWLTY